MRSTRTKRALAFLMSVLLTFTTFTSDANLLTVNATGTDNYSTSVTANDDNVNVKKTASISGDEVTITFDVENLQTSQTDNKTTATDVVFVLDCTSSMGDNFATAKTGIANFSKALIDSKENADKNIRIGVASFAYKGYEDVSLTNPWRDSNGKLVDEKTHNSAFSKIETSIKNIVMATNDDFPQRKNGTNMQAGILKAEDMLSRSPEGTNKIIVLLSDGVPTYSYKVTGIDGTETYSFNYSTVKGCGGHYNIHYEDSWGYCDDGSYSVTTRKTGWYDENGDLKYESAPSKNFYRQGSLVDGVKGYVYSERIDLTTVYENEGKYYRTRDYHWNWNSSYYTYSNEVNADYVIEKSGKYYVILSNNTVKNPGDYTIIFNDYTKAAFKFTETLTYHTSITKKVENNGEPTIAEANIAKSKGISLYTIGYNLDAKDEDYNNAINVLTNVATSPSLFMSASTANVDSILASVSESVTNQIMAANGTTVIDTFPDYLKVQNGEGYTVTTDSKTGKDTVQWSMGDKETASFTVTAKISDYEKMFAENGLTATDFVNGNYVKLNDNCVINYLDKDGVPRELDDIKEENVPYGMVTTYAYSITYKCDGEELTGKTVTGADVLGKEITVPMLDGEYENPAHYSVSVTGAENNKLVLKNGENKVVVEYTTNEYTVNFYQHDADHTGNDWTKACDEQKVKYGEGATAPSDPSNYIDGNFEYSFKEWSCSFSNITENTDVYASYNDGVQLTYDVTFMAKDVSGNWKEIDKVPVNAGETTNATSNTVAPLASTDAGVKEVAFDGNWYTNTDRTGKFDFANTAINNDVVLYAGYVDVPKTYNIEYVDLNGNTIKTLADVSYNEEIKAIDYTGDPKEDGKNVYFFSKWDKAGEKATDDLVKENSDNLIIVYAVPTEGEDLYYTVNWYLNSDDKESLYSKTYKYNESAVYSGEIPSKDKDAQYTYSFVDFVDAKNPDAHYASDYTFEKISVDLIAYFSKETNKYNYSFTYMNENGELVTPDKYSGNAEYGTTIDVPAAGNVTVSDNNGTVTDYVFDKWDDPSVTGATVVITKDTCTKAIYNGTTSYLVTFMNGNEIVDEKYVVSGDTLFGKYPEAPSKKEDYYNTYSFDKWSVSDDVKITEPTTVNAVFTENAKEYKLTVNVFYPGNEGTKNYESESVGFDKEAVYKLADINNEVKKYIVASVEGCGYTEMPADNTFSVKITESTLNPVINITLEAAPKYKIVYHEGLSEQKGRFSLILKPENAKWLADSDAVYSGENFVLREDLTAATIKNVKYTYTFNGKWTDGNGKVLDLANLKADGADVNVYAAYDKETNKYTVTFVDELLNVSIPVSVEYGSNLYGKMPKNPATPEDTVDTHYLGGDSWRVNSGEAITGDKTVYANHPSEVRKYTVTFLNENGREISSSKVPYDSYKQAPGADKKDGYIFDGWFDKDDKLVLKDHASVKVTEDITLKAKYSPKTYTANFYVLWPENLGKVQKEENRTNTQDAVGQDSNYYSESQGTAEFTYSSEIGMEYTETFGTWINNSNTGIRRSQRVDGFFKTDDGSDIPEVTLTHEVNGNKFELSDIEWYVLKNTTAHEWNVDPFSRSKASWHVDGFANSVTLVKPDVNAELYTVLNYNGEVRNDEVLEWVEENGASQIKNKFPNGKLTFKNVTLTEGTEVKDVNVYENAATATFTYSAKLGKKTYSVDVTVPVKVEVVKADAVVTITGKTTTVTYNGKTQNVTLEYESKIDVSNNAPSDIELTLVDETRLDVSAKNAGQYYAELTAEDFATKSANLSVKVVIEKDAELVIEKADATITVDNKSSVYGNADPEFTATVEGTVNDEVLNYSLSRIAGRNVGSYAITAVLPETDEVNDNYNIEVVDGTLTIGRRDVTVYVGEYTKYQGDADPAFSYTSDGEAYGERVALFAYRNDMGNDSVGNHAVVARLANPGEVGYAINQNYNIRVVNGNLEILAREGEPVVTPPTGGGGGGGITVVQETTPVEIVEEVEIAEEPAPLVETVEEAPVEEVEIPEEEVPLTVEALCWIHWLILGLTLVYAIYAVLRAVQNKRELEDDAETANN